jgi:hypothetical protein
MIDNRLIHRDYTKGWEVIRTYPKDWTLADFDRWMRRHDVSESVVYQMAMEPHLPGDYEPLVGVGTVVLRTHEVGS